MQKLTVKGEQELCKEVEVMSKVIHDNVITIVNYGYGYYKSQD